MQEGDRHTLQRLTHRETDFTETDRHTEDKTGLDTQRDRQTDKNRQYNKYKG